MDHPNDIIERALVEQPILSIRSTFDVPRLGEVLGERFGQLGAYLATNGVVATGSPFVRYHTFDDPQTDCETGVPIAGPAAGDGQIKPGSMPAGPAVSTSHEGPDEELGDAYRRIGAWLAESGREAAGPAWEVYHWIDLNPGSGNEQEPAPRRIEIVQPIR